MLAFVFRADPLFVLEMKEFLRTCQDLWKIPACCLVDDRPGNEPRETQSGENACPSVEMMQLLHSC